MTGAAVQTYLLEKTRVACQASSERNFHIFYQVCVGCSALCHMQGWVACPSTPSMCRPCPLGLLSNRAHQAQFGHRGFAASVRPEGP